MDERTVEVYRRDAERWATRREPSPAELAARRATIEAGLVSAGASAGASAGPSARASAGPSPRTVTFDLDGPVADLGCGPGFDLDALGGAGRSVLGLDASRAMLTIARRRAPGAIVVQADLEALPIRSGFLGGAWASRSYVHVPPERLPLALGDLHRSLRTAAPARLHLFGGPLGFGPLEGDDFPGRSFARWPPDRLVDVVRGAGFSVHQVRTTHPTGTRMGLIELDLRRAWSLSDTVGPGMRLLVCGLNPSPRAAELGVGYAGPANRFWTAAVTAGVVARPLDARAALADDGVGMTDLCKRTTRRADELRPSELRAGLARVERLVEWLDPTAVCVVGLAGWRVALDRRASPGVQPNRLGGRPVYLMPSTSGRNASSSKDALVEHLAAAAQLADRSPLETH